MSDPRIREYARLLVERCLGVQPGWQVLIRSTPLARPLVEEVSRALAHRGAYPILRVNFTLWPVDLVWAAEAPLELLGELPEIDRYASDTMDARITISAPENTRDGTMLGDERQGLANQAERYFLRRSMNDEIPWVGCQYPCPALAQDAGMTLSEFEDFLYGAVLLDWDELGRRMERIRDRFDAADELRIVGTETDLVLGLAGRSGRIDDGHTNMPGGEVFYSPLEDSAEGVITYSEFPAVEDGREVVGARLRFEGGRVVEASAESGEEFLLHMLDTDAGARRIGELGIGCNPGITRHMRNTLFDEKIDGTVHIALGQSYPITGGTNESDIHWDMVKDLRSGGRLYCDGELVQEDGRWLI